MSDASQQVAGLAEARAVDTQGHSPGPWTIDWNRAGGGQHPDYPELFYAGITSANAPDALELNASGWWRKPDTYLIAAAPELLALARKLASECAECGGSAEKIRASGPAPEDEYAEPCAECADIWAVINKAEGRS